MQEEIDLGHYVEVLVRRWRLLAVMLLLGVLAAGLMTIVRTRFYVARVLLANVGEHTQVSFEPAIKSLSWEQLELVNGSQRLATLVRMVQNPRIAETVIDQLEDLLPEELRWVEALLPLVRATQANGGDAIEIIVTYTEPQVTTAIANAWGDEYVRQVNHVYRSQDAESLDAVQQEIEAVRGTYEQAQSSLESALRRSQFDALKARIAELRALVEGLSGARGLVVQSLFEEVTRTEAWLRAAQEMRDQLHSGDTSAALTNGPALLLLKAQVFASEPTVETWHLWQPATSSPPANPVIEQPPLLPGSPGEGEASQQIQLQIQAPATEITPEEMLQDLDALIEVLRGRRDALSSQRAAILADAATGQPWLTSYGSQSGGEGADGGSEPVPDDPASLAAIEERLRDLETQLLHEQLQLTIVRTQRDLAWETYGKLLRKEAELLISSRSAGSEVRLAAPGLAVRERGGLWRNGLIGAVAGLVLGAMAAYCVEFWQDYRRRTGASADRRALR